MHAPNQQEHDKTLETVLNVLQEKAITLNREKCHYAKIGIYDLVTISEPLRKLTHKNAVFKWGQAEQDSFDQLKKCLANANTLGYYDN